VTWSTEKACSANFLDVRSWDKKMPNNGTRTLTGDSSAIAPDDKALNEKGLNGKPG
jgi:hypothetical protein